MTRGVRDVAGAAVTVLIVKKSVSWSFGTTLIVKVLFWVEFGAALLGKLGVDIILS